MATAYYDSEFLSAFKVLFFHLVKLSNAKQMWRWDAGYYNMFRAFDDKISGYLSGSVSRWDMRFYLNSMILYTKYTNPKKIRQTLILMKNILEEKGLYCDSEF